MSLSNDLAEKIELEKENEDLRDHLALAQLRIAELENQISDLKQRSIYCNPHHHDIDPVVKDCKFDLLRRDSSVDLEFALSALKAGGGNQ